jgi:hypothetical protein
MVTYCINYQDKNMETRNHTFNVFGAIDCEINHPVYGWIPTTLSADDAETASLFNEVSTGSVAEYIPPPPPPVEEQLATLTKQYQLAVQQHLDSTARSFGYDDMNSCGKYLRQSSPFYAECVALLDWCDAVWLFCYAELDKYTDPTTVPSVDAFIASLPVYGGV